MNSIDHRFIFVALLVTIVGCGIAPGKPSDESKAASVQSSESRETKIDQPNELGFARVCIRDGDLYLEGILDAQGKEVVQPQSNLLVMDISGSLALVQLERKFLFVPLDSGLVSQDDLESVDGFQYAEPYRGDLALVKLEDSWFYIHTDGERAFNSVFDFAESFHHDRALVMVDDRYRIIDTKGKTVADLNYAQISPQSPWFWQVTNVEQEKYRSGFVDLNGNAITELIYDEVGYYDPMVMRLRVRTKDHYGFVDEYAKIVIPVQYEYAEDFSHEKAKVLLNGRSLYIDPYGIEVP